MESAAANSKCQSNEKKKSFMLPRTNCLHSLAFTSHTKLNEITPREKRATSKWVSRLWTASVLWFWIQQNKVDVSRFSRNIIFLREWTTNYRFCCPIFLQLKLISKYSSDSHQKVTTVQMQSWTIPSEASKKSKKSRFESADTQQNNNENIPHLISTYISSLLGTLIISQNEYSRVRKKYHSKEEKMTRRWKNEAIKGEQEMRWGWVERQIILKHNIQLSQQVNSTVRVS